MRLTVSTPVHGRCATEGGFTLIELVVVLGLLSSFLLMLVQMLGSGVEMFSQGQRGQDLSDRAHLAQHAISDSVRSLVGPARTVYEDTDPVVRLLVHFDRLGFPLEGDEQDESWVQVMRGTVSLTEVEEADMLAEFFRQEAEEAGGDEVAVAETLARLVAQAPRQGRATMMLVPWPTDGDGVFLELRHGLYSSSPDLGDVPVLDVEVGSKEFPRDAFLASTAPILSGLLHVEFAMWAQNTRGWDARPGGGGPELAWDSARAGRLFELTDEKSPRAHQFGLDLGPASRRDLRDDVYPRALRITVVVARSANEPPEAFLDDAIASDAKALRVNRIDDLPLATGGGWLKLGSEWIRYAERRGRNVRGLVRGQRGTLAKNHKRGAAVRIGKTIVLTHKMAHGRDAGSGDV